MRTLDLWGFWRSSASLALTRPVARRTRPRRAEALAAQAPGSQAAAATAVARAQRRFAEHSRPAAVAAARRRQVAGLDRAPIQRLGSDAGVVHRRQPLKRGL